MPSLAGPVIFKKSLLSTNDFMHEQIAAGLISAEGTVVSTYQQTKGRGLDGSEWESEPGKNLTFSVLLKPDFLFAHQQFSLNKVVSLAVMDFVKRYVHNQKVSIKWPNDIYIHNGKVAGILINNTISGNRMLHSVVGIGININQETFSGKAANPVSLIQFTGKPFDRFHCLEEIISDLSHRYLELSQGNPLVISRDYLAALYRINEPHLYRYTGETITATITGISEYGHLKLIQAGYGIIECDFKEIEFII